LFKINPLFNEILKFYEDIEEVLDERVGVVGGVGVGCLNRTNLIPGSSVGSRTNLCKCVNLAGNFYFSEIYD
jgi:hypothetical protein